MERIWVVGTSGSGKTTVAARLSGLLGIPHIELDSLHFAADWVEVPTAELRDKVAGIVKTQRWVIDGNYPDVEDLVLPNADTAIWLDYPLLTVLSQVTARTIRRIATRQELWAGNRERVRTAFFSSDSIILWALRSHGVNRQRYRRLFRSTETAHLRVLRFKTPERADLWLGSVEARRERDRAC